MLNRLLVAGCLILTGVAAPARAQEKPLGGAGQVETKAPDPVTSARIYRDFTLAWRGNLPSDVRPLQQRIAADVWRSEAGKAALKDLGMSEQAAKSAFKVASTRGGDVRLMLTLPIDTPAAREATLRFFDELAAKVVPDAVKRWADEVNELPLLRAEEALDYARKEFEMVRQRATEQRQKVRQVAEVLDPSPEAVRGATSRLEQERQRIQLELVGQNARLKALQERVSQLADTAAVKAKDDRIAAELEQIVKTREQALERVHQLLKSRDVAPAEVASIETQLAEAKAKLLERREAAARSAGTELLGELNKELITLSITIVENEARLEYVGRRLKGLANAGDLVDELEQLQANAARAAKQLEAAETERTIARRQATISPAFSASVTWDEPRMDQSPKSGGR